MTAGIVEAGQKFQLGLGQPAARALQFECEGIAAMPEQQVAGPGEHAHTLEARGLVYVARAAVRNVQPQHIGLGAQAQMLDNCGLQLRLGLRAAGRSAIRETAARAGHGATRRRHSGISRPSSRAGTGAAISARRSLSQGTGRREVLSLHSWYWASVIRFSR